MRRSLAALPLAVLVLISTASIALADDAVLTGPGFIVVCVGQTDVVRVGGMIVVGPVGPQFQDSATVTLSVLGPNPIPNATVSYQLVDDTVVLPADWTSLPGGTGAADRFTFDVTITATAPGLGSPVAAWSASVDGGVPESIYATGLEILTAACPSVTVNQAASQADPTDQAGIKFDVVFSLPVVGFDASDVVIGGTAGGANPTVTGSGATYVVTVGSVATSGTVIVSIPAGSAVAGYGPNDASTSTDNTVTYAAAAPPSVTPTNPTGPPSDTAVSAQTTDRGTALPLVLLALAAISVTLLVVPRRRPR